MKMNLTTSEKNRGFVRFLLMSLLLSILILPAHAQDRVTVSGQLTDSSQTPLIGASVIEKGTTNGVTTDADGRYQISVKPDGVIDFSFIGYKPQSLAVMNRTEINVTMEEDATMIGEVVAIGYGSQRKEDLSMAVSTVKVDDAARSRAAADAPRRVKCSRCQAALRLGMFAAGLAGIIVGSQLLVDHGSRLALALGVPASVIGVTLVAVGTSLPELVTTLTAIVKKEASMSIGNIVGANVIDLTLILPVCAALSDGRLAIGRQTNVLDLPACLLAGAISMLPPLATGRFYRWQGFALLGGYAVYLMLLLR